MPWRRVDGNDVVAVAAAMAEAAEHARAGEGPFFIEAVTYRWRGHVGPSEDIDVGVQRKDDLALWKKRDPIARLAAALDLELDWESAREQVVAAWAKAAAAEPPSTDALLNRVFS